MTGLRKTIGSGKTFGRTPNTETQTPAASAAGMFRRVARETTPTPRTGRSTSTAYRRRGS